MCERCDRKGVRAPAARGACCGISWLTRPPGLSDFSGFPHGPYQLPRSWVGIALQLISRFMRSFALTAAWVTARAAADDRNRSRNPFLAGPHLDDCACGCGWPVGCCLHDESIYTTRIPYPERLVQSQTTRTAPLRACPPKIYFRGPPARRG